MKLFLEKGTIKNELADAFEQFEFRISRLGIEPDEFVEEFHNNNITATGNKKNRLRKMGITRRHLLLSQMSESINSVISVTKDLPK